MTFIFIPLIRRIRATFSHKGRRGKWVEFGHLLQRIRRRKWVAEYYHKIIIKLILIYFLTYNLAIALPQENNPIINDGNLYFIELTVGKDSFNDLIESYYHNGKLYIPLGQVFAVFEFPITVSAKVGTASGWFANEKNTFKLDLATNTFETRGQVHEYNPSQVIRGKHEIYMESALLEKAINIKMDFNPTSMKANITPLSYSFPKHAFKNRTEQWNSYNPSNKDYSKFHVIEGKYETFTMPILDVYLSDIYRIRPNNKNDFNYSVKSANHIAGMFSNAFVTGINERVNNIQLNLGKEDRHGQLLGPLKAKSYYLGDVTSIVVPLTSRTTLGRGVSISNYPITQLQNVDGTVINGFESPGWQIELYKDDELRDFITVDASGFYEFNLPITFGVNNFKLIFYGPQGQIREETRSFHTSDLIPLKNELRYGLYAGEKNRALVETKFFREANSRNDNGAKVGSIIEYGIAKDIGGRIGFVHTPLPKDAFTSQEHSYVSGGIITTKLQPFLFITDYAHDITKNGDMIQLSGLRNYNFFNFYDANIKADQLFLSNFDSEFFNNGRTADSLKTRSAIDISGVLKTAKRIGLAFFAKREHFSLKTKKYTATNRISTNLTQKITVTNFLSYEKTKYSASPSYERAIGTFLFNDRLTANTTLRGELEYGFLEEKAFRSLDVSMQHYFNRDVYGDLRVRKDMTRKNHYSFQSDLSWNVQKAKLGLSVGGDNHKEFFVGASVNFSLAREPRTKKWHMQADAMTTSAPISLQHYIDNNYNNKFDEGDELVDDAEILTNRKVVKEQHVTFAPNAAAHQEFHVHTKDDLLDHDVCTAHEGIIVYPKPGAFNAIDVPIIHASEVEGEVYHDDDGERVALFKCPVQLIDANNDQVISEVKTESDGFYLFEKVKDGAYKLRVEPEYAANHGLKHKEIAINTDSKKTVVVSRSIACKMK